jgi:hypothetical protein
MIGNLDVKVVKLLGNLLKLLVEPKTIIYLAKLINFLKFLDFAKKLINMLTFRFILRVRD